MQDTGKFRNTKDQFYTKPEIAKKCISEVIRLCPETAQYLWIEPSAGTGAFLNSIPYRKIGIDIEPKSVGIIEQEFLTWPLPDEDFLLIGNPPFGRQSTLAKAFIKKGQDAKVIAFILPKSFTKPSMFNVFESHFHCIYTEDIPPNSFLLNDLEYDVPCVFQLWKKQDTIREVPQQVKESGFKYSKNSDWDITIRRVGVNAGKCYVDKKEYSPQSHYFITFDKEVDILDIAEKLNSHTFPSNTVGPRSLSKTEINIVLNSLVNELLLETSA
jgi:hypothetical protein